jgi:hypothetical protein
MKPPIAISGYTVSAEGDRVTHKSIQIPATTELTCLYALADQDGWTGGFMWRTGDGTEVALEENELQ